MNKIKLLVPFAALIAVTLSSCNKNGSSIPDITFLNRVQYKEANSYTELVDTFVSMYKDQFPSPPENNQTAWSNMPFKISEQGTETVQYSIKVSGTVKLDYINELGAYPVNYNNIDIALANTVTVSWNISNKEKPYLKIANQQESYYVGIEKDSSGEDYSLYRYHNSPVKGKLYKTYVDYLNSDELDYFSNTILREAFSNSSISLNPLKRRWVRNNRSIGFDLSGFIYPEQYHNAYVSNGGNLLSPGYWLKTEEIALQLDEFALINPIQELSFRCASDGAKTGSMEIKLDKCDLSEYSSLAEVTTGLRVAGKMNFDYFAAYADSLIKQQEFIFDLKNGSALGVITGSNVLKLINGQGSSYSSIVVVDASNLNISIHANQEVSNKCETVDEYNPSDYIEIY